MLSIAFLHAPSVGAEESLTLAQAVSQALANNPGLASDQPALEAARAQLAVTRAGYLPRVDFEQSYTAGNNPVYVFGTLLTQQRFTAANFALPSLNTPDPIDNLQTRLVVQQSLWDAGRTRSRTQAARYGLDATERDNEDHIRTLLLEVLDAYWALSLARESLDAARVALQSAGALAKQAKERVDSGLAVEADHLRAEAFLASARQREIQDQGLVETAIARLNLLMGAPLSDAIGSTSPLKRAPLTHPDKTRLIAEQRRSRPDYRKLSAELRRAEADASIHRADSLPSIGAFTVWELDKPSFVKSGGNNWTAGIGLRWNLYSGGANSAELRAARSRVEQIKKQLIALESAMEFELHRAWVESRTTQQQVETALSAEAQSAESLRILRNRYEAGLATMTDLLSAETARAQARMTLAVAIYRQRVSLGRLESAAGILNPTSSSMIP